MKGKKKIKQHFSPYNDIPVSLLTSFNLQGKTSKFATFLTW